MSGTLIAIVSKAANLCEVGPPLSPKLFKNRLICDCAHTPCTVVVGYQYYPVDNVLRGNMMMSLRSTSLVRLVRLSVIE